MKNKSQLNAINYAVSDRTYRNSEALYSVTFAVFGISVTKAKYPAITIRRCLTALEDAGYIIEGHLLYDLEKRIVTRHELVNRIK